MILEEKLITLRKSLGLSQEDLASKLDVSRQAVYKWEAGQAVPEISKLKILSSLYNVSIDNLLDNKADIVYMNTPKSRYGAVIVKKTLDSDVAEKDNTKLLPEEEKQLKKRKLILGIAKAVTWACFGLAILFFILAGVATDEQVGISNTSTCLTFIVLWIIVAITKGILNKVVYPKVILARTYFNQELDKATKELNEKYDTIIQLQPDILVWFIYDTKTNSFGFYFDGEMQFYCPIQNFAKLNVIEDYESLIPFDINYFDENGKILKYEISLSTFRDFWKHDKTIKNAETLEFKMLELEGKTKAVINEIQRRLDIEKSRI